VPGAVLAQLEGIAMKKFVLLALVCLLALLAFSATASASTLTLAKLAKQVAALQKKVKTQATTITSQGTTIATLQGKLTADEATIAGQGTKIGGLAADLASAQSTITALQNSQTTGVSSADFNALASKVTTAQGDIGTLQTSVSGLQTSVSGLNTQVSNQGNVIIALANIVGQDANSGLRGTVAAHTSILTSAAPLLAIAPYVSLKSETLNGVVGPNIVFQGANVHVRSTTGETDASGTGNLIVGWDQAPTSPAAGYRSGSNNLVCGDKQAFHSYGGFIAGCANGVGDAYATVAGGYGNNVSGYAATVSGGSGNTASMAYSAVNGGLSNYTGGSGVYAVVSGGRSNGATGRYSVVSAGQGLITTTDDGWNHP
jgi:hypothetical protein